MITVEYKNTVLQVLKTLRDSEVKDLDKNSPKYPAFVTAVKIIIDWGQDIANGFEVEFNQAYTKIRKRNLLTKNQ